MFDKKTTKTTSVITAILSCTNENGPPLTNLYFRNLKTIPKAIQQGNYSNNDSLPNHEYSESFKCPYRGKVIKISTNKQPIVSKAL